MPIRRKVIVKGELKGSGYLEQAQKIARNLGVGGWVRNASNGDVEACFEGDEGAVYAILAWCFIGPERSRVDQVIIRNTSHRGRCRELTIRADRRAA